MKKFPAYLFIKKTALNPNLQINSIAVMDVGDPDQLLGYTSLSSGAVTYTSSDNTIATIVVSGGSSYLHAVAGGNVTVTAHQSAQGDYTSATSPTTAQIIQFPVISGITARFPFWNTNALVLASGNVQQITDTISSIVSSQSNASLRPVYNANGGLNNYGYATFNGSKKLGGNLIQNTTSFTMIAVHRVTGDGSVNQIGTWCNGVEIGGDGYAIINYIPANGYLYDGGIMQWVAFFHGNGAISTRNQWMIQIISHTSGTTKLYNTLANLYAVNNANPNAPSTSHTIGSGGGAGFIGDITELALVNRQISDSEVLQLCNYYISKFNMPLPSKICTGGDSRFTDTGGAPNAPDQTLHSELSVKYSYLNNTAVPSRTTDQLIAALPTEVIATYQSRVNDAYCFMMGYNDIVAGKTETYIYNNIVTICNTVRAAGYKVIVCTDMYSTNATFNAVQDIYNASIRTNWATFADALCDLNSLVTAAQMANPTYSNDGLHPTAFTAGIMATAMQSAINPFL